MSIYTTIFQLAVWNYIANFLASWIGCSSSSLSFAILCKCVVVFWSVINYSCYSGGSCDIYIRRNPFFTANFLWWTFLLIRSFISIFFFFWTPGEQYSYRYRLSSLLKVWFGMYVFSVFGMYVNNLILFCLSIWQAVVAYGPCL